MTIEDLKTILVNHLDLGSRKQGSANREIVEQIIPGGNPEEVKGAEISAFQVDGTAVLISDANFRLPHRIVFVDLKSRASFVEELER